jgi:biopolymer transport protein ExbB
MTFPIPHFPCALTTLAAAPPAGGGDLWRLFAQSFDVFTVLLVLGSLYASAVIVRCALDIRRSNVFPEQAAARAEQLAEQQRWGELRTHARAQDGYLGGVLGAALDEAHRGRSVMDDAAELAASRETASWFRRAEPLNLIGNLGPLVGLAGTVWGMILAFTSLGETGGQAGPAELSEGISKALFHTLLGLLLAIPCLLAFGYFRARIDDLCTEAITRTARLVGRIPAGDDCPDALRPEHHADTKGDA